MEQQTGGRRTPLLLAAAAAIGGAVGPIAIGMGGLVGLSLLPHEQMGLATVPVTAFVVGSTLASIPAALSMQRFGRRAGFTAGALLGAVAALLAGAAIAGGSFSLFAAAMTLLGAASAYGQQYRFAAADSAPPAFKARAIAWVMGAGVLTGVVGPQIAIHGRSLWPETPFVGPFVILALLLVLTAGILLQLRIPAPRRAHRGQSGRPLGAILRQPRFIVALATAVAAFSLMSLVMTATPLAMVAHHHSTADSQLAIQWHVIAMFAPSFVTGPLIGRFGKTAVTAVGLLLIGAAATVAVAGTGLAYFWCALILLGVGWNFAFLAATAMVAELYRPEEAFKVQAANEFILFGVVAMASLASGGLLASAGWVTLNLLVYPFVLASLALVLGLALHERRTATAARTEQPGAT